MRLVHVDGADVQVYGLTTFDTRFLYNEIVFARSYGDLRLPPGSLVVDVGANIGLFTLYVKRLCPSANVLAFEPSHAAAAFRKNMAHLGFSGVVLHEVALGAESEDDVPFTYYPLLPSSSTRYPDKQGALQDVFARSLPARVVQRMYQGTQMPVSVKRLSSYLPVGRPVDLLKVDVVGSELDVLDGIDPGHWRLVRRVVLDVQDVEGRASVVRERFERAGFDVTVRPAPTARNDGLNYLVEAMRQG
jgi:FkbM family methyltransferase